MTEIKQSLLTGYPNLISYDCTQIILDQMKKNICKIKIDQEQGTGFFTKIPFPTKENMLPVLITNNHVIKKELLEKGEEKILIKIKEDNDFKKINLKERKYYTNEEYDITILEIKTEDEIKDFLELDNIILNDILNNENKNVEYMDKTIYIIQYPKGELSVSYGVLDKIYEDKRYNFNHKCSTEKGSSGSPILYSNNKVIGVHKEGHTNNFNKGSFLDLPIKEFIKKNYKNKDKNSEVNEKLLKSFNKKYNKGIKNTEIYSINIRQENLGNNGLKDLCSVPLINLKELNLELNNISNIKSLENAKFDNLEILNLGKNAISDISVLDKVNFKELKNLCLNVNNISDIKVLEGVKFYKLEKLDLSFNQIGGVDVLEKVKFKKLKELILKENHIDNIDILENTDFEKLEILDLTNNKITNINVLEKVNFKDLKRLFLNQNNINDINVLENIVFEKIEILDFD